jgi:conjugal transfer pilus assembly protein TraE
MNVEIYTQKLANKEAANRLLKFAIVVIGAAVLIDSFMLFMALDKQTVVLIPPGLEHKAEVSGGQLSEEYVRTFARYVSMLALTYSPATARSQFEDLLLLFTPESYKDAFKTFYDLASVVEQKNVSSVFYVTQPIRVNVREKTMEVEGLLRRYKDNQKLDEAVKKYDIRYQVDEGKFKLVKFGEKESK